MAEFNPSINVAPAQDQTGASRGTGPNKAFETLFSGLGDTTEGAVQTADNFVQGKIESDARYAFDGINDEMGLSSDVVPGEITQTAEGLSKLAQAQSQGKVTQEYYYQRLASTLKGLRAKYPGYEKEVDNIVTSVTGTRPANAFRDALFSNIEAANRSAASSSSDFTKWVRQDGNIGYVQNAFPDYFNDPNKYTPDEVYAGVAKLKGQDQTWASQKGQIEGSKEYANQALNERLNQVTASGLEGQSRAMGMSGGDFMKKLNDSAAKGGLGPDEKAGLSNAMEQYIFTANNKLIKETSDPAFQKMFSPQELEERRQAALKPLYQIRDLINSDKYDQAALIVARNNNMQNQARSALYKKDPRLVGVDTFSKISPEAGQYVLDSIVKDAGGPTGYFDKVALADITAGIVSGDDTVNEGVQRIMDNKASSSADKNAQAGGLVKNFTSLLRSGKLEPQEVSKIVSQNYATDGKDVFTLVDSTTDKNGNSQYLRLYNDMFNPEITKNIVATNDAAALKKYTEAAVDKFQAIPEFRKAAADLGQNIDYGKFLRAHYDEKTNRLVLEADQGAIDNMGFFSKTDNRGFVSRAVKAKDALNQALSVVVPIIEANGGSEAEGVQTLIKNMAIDLDPDEKGGFFNWINEHLDGVVSSQGKNKTGDFKEVGGDTPSIDSAGSLKFNKTSSTIDPVQSVLDAKSNYAPEKSGNQASAAIDELITSNKRGYNPDTENIHPDVTEKLKGLQGAFGKQIPIVSGFRDPERNAKAGGAKHSQHMKGNAVDLDVSGMSRDEVIDLIKKAREMGFGGIGVYPNSLHVDVGPTRAWGPTYHSDSLPSWARKALG